MISRGAQVHGSSSETTADPLRMAELEYNAGRCPLYYKRFLPGHTDETPNIEIVRVVDVMPD